MAQKDVLGRQGEQFAAEHLERSGYSIVDRNWRCRQGEIDIVALRDGVLVFVEVKTRSGIGYGLPSEAVSVSKLQRLRRLAGAWCAEHESRIRAMRLDVIGIVVKHGQDIRLDHLEGVS